MPEEPSWLTVAEAARRMGVSTQAVRGRIKRGTLDARRDNRNRLLVLVANDDAVPDANPTATLRERVARLEERLEASEAARADLRAERDRLLALVEQLTAERRPERRPWPGVRAWLRRVWEGDG